MSSVSLQRMVFAVAVLTVGCVIRPSEAGNASFTYDLVGRVTTALYDNGSCVAYSYDANGNRTSQTNTISGAPESATWGSGVFGCFNWTSQ